jgi:nucleotide-binding universal stress UspA family protein
MHELGGFMIEIKRILCPTDFSEASMAALPYAVDIARLFKAQVFVIHVVPPLPSITEGSGVYIQMPLDYLDSLRTDADKQIDQMLRDQIPKEVKASKVLVDGDPAYEILQSVEKLQIDLIAIATHGRTGWQHLVFGSVAEKVVRMSKVPVLTVREKSVANQGL